MAPKTPTESNVLRSKYFDKIQLLMNDLEVRSLIKELDTTKDWGKTLSGGQKKMVAIMRAIL